MISKEVEAGGRYAVLEVSAGRCEARGQVVALARSSPALDEATRDKAFKNAAEVRAMTKHSWREPLAVDAGNGALQSTGIRKLPQDAAILEIAHFFAFRCHVGVSLQLIFLGFILQFR